MSKTSFVSRINQIDAVQLDDEIYKVLRSQVEEITKYLTPGLIVQWRPEIDVVIKFLIWNYSLNKKSSTFGQQLLNLSYKNLDRRKSILLLLFLTVPNYLRDRLMNENYILSRLPAGYTRTNFRDYVEKIDNFYCLLSLIWSFLFMHAGNQPRLIEKFLCIHNQSSNMNKPRPIGYSYMTRELLWHGLIELFTISLPMIDFRKLHRLWNNLWVSKKNNASNLSLSCKLDINSKCAYCNQSPILPRWAGCSHVFCYYCLEGLFMTSDPYKCTICDNDLFYANVKTYLNV